MQTGRLHGYLDEMHMEGIREASIKDTGETHVSRNPCTGYLPIIKIPHAIRVNYGLSVGEVDVTRLTSNFILSRREHDA